jgi:hypothetical protein
LLRTYSKFARLQVEKSLQSENKSSGIRCQFTPFCARLPSFFTSGAYEDHYIQFHTHVCKECSRVLPTDHLLDLHLCEVHDSYFAVLSARKSLYKCFVDDCQILSVNPSERIQHLCTIHKYPQKFNFDIVLGEDGRKRNKINRNKKNSKANDRTGYGKAKHQSGDREDLGEQGAQIEIEKKSVANHNDDEMDLDGLTNQISSISLMVPNTIKFGGRGGYRKHVAVSLEKVKLLHDGCG